MTRQWKLIKWAVEMFGTVALDPKERALRLIEEALEVVQTVGLTREDIIPVLDRTFNRKPGELGNELGGLIMTAEALAEILNIDLQHEAEREYKRITSIPKEQWQCKHAEKVAAGTAIPQRD